MLFSCDAHRNAKSSIREKYASIINSVFEDLVRFACFLLGNSPASEFYMPTFRNTLFHLYRQVGVE